MITRNFQDLKLSALGFGAMRLPVMGSDDTPYTALTQSTYK